ncbi:hypothetical protein RHS01_09187 [Rhizoctonia solani]|uniref:Uncharacterized protein n=1 Tax=Rhizoctonia solani TaxID=456999 RepID=A0A8H7M1L4_9AGAM|nr:hypothetical protein RHS01_09187 [Rhizoctonia solani]
MSGSRTSSTNRSYNKIPFTVETIKQYEPFMALNPSVKAKICELLASGVVNEKGNIKQPLNSYLLSRQKLASKPKEQRSNRCDEPSEQTSATASEERNDFEERMAEYKLQANQVINEEGRKKWFLDCLAFVSKNMLKPDARPCSLDINEWIRDPSTISIFPHRTQLPTIHSPAQSPDHASPHEQPTTATLSGPATTSSLQQHALPPVTHSHSTLATLAHNPVVDLPSSSETLALELTNEINEIWRDNDDTEGDHLQFHPNPARVYEEYMTSGYEAMMDYITSFRPSTQDESEPSYDYTELIHEYMNPIAYEDDNEFGDEDDTVPPTHSKLTYYWFNLFFFV